MALILINENPSCVVKPVRAIDAAGAKGRSAPCVSCLTRCPVSLISCRDQIVLVAESVTCIRHFVPKFNFLCFERQDQFPFPVRRPVPSWRASVVLDSSTSRLC